MSKRYITRNADGGISITQTAGDDPDGLQLTKTLFALSRTTDTASFDPANTSESNLGSYRRPTKAKPCLVYTEEQIAGLNDGSLHFGDIEGSFEQIHS